MNDNDISDHNLYLLVDGQLDRASKKKLMDKIDASPELKQKLAGISKVKELIGLAYMQELPRPSAARGKPATASSSVFVALAACLIMGLGLTLGWISHHYYDSSEHVVAAADNPAVISRPEIPVDLSTQIVRKYMLHVSFLNEAQLDNALVESSSILDSYAATGLPVQMELAFDLQAVRIFEPQHIGQAQKIISLLGRYENLEVYACSESLGRLLGEMEKPEEMSGFHTNRVVQEMVPERIKQGWIYIKV